MYVAMATDGCRAAGVGVEGDVGDLGALSLRAG
jgi:hypothetical protein